MHVDWESIKQRPQFIAEGLSKFYEIYIFYPISYFNLLKRLIRINNKNSNINTTSIPYLPLYTLIRQIYDINKYIWKIYFKYIINKHNPDYIWITFPALYDFIPSCTQSKVIYDCMDDAIAFNSGFYFKDRLLNSEKELIQKAVVIFVSANNLTNKLNQREKCKDKIVLNRNAFDGKIFNIKTNNSKEEKKTYKIGYVGAISSWFDFDALYFTLNNLKNIEYHLIGPLDTKYESHERIKLYGSIKHENLYSHIKNFDCFIMPFKLNKLIYSVDPVKLYEYINYNKPIISVYYEEINRFKPFVSFYHNKKDLNTLLASMIKQKFPKKYSNEQRIDFLKINTWNERIETILKNMDR